VNLARAALAVLEADPVLRDFNLVVSVVDRVAVVGGPVASVELKDRAAELVRRVPGVRAVRNGCFVQTTTEPLLRTTASTTRPLPVLPPLAVPLRPSGAAEATPPVGDLVVAAPQPEPLARERSVVARRPTAPGANVLLPPVASQPAAAAPVSPYPASPGVLTGRPTLADSIESVRRSDARFVGLRAELREGGMVLVTGTARQPADAWDFADLLRGVPGLTRVAVGPVGR
ncbi:BON domain-containing protein, partial [bacterium]|nr:BON domain-containing protein [bacterium]